MKFLSVGMRMSAFGLAVVLAGCASSGGGAREESSAAKPAPSAEAPAAQTPATPDTSSTPAIVADPNMGTVVFFREGKFVGSMVSFMVREGDVELGKLSNGTYFVAKVPPGPHTYRVHSEAKDELSLEVEAGETYYVQGSISMGVLVGRPNLSPSDAATFEKLKADLKDSAAPKGAQKKKKKTA